ncbi:nitroreductase family protein [Bailinhaonella thermotolerans]|uniref:Nitroreductase family protein n=1 Tax=Bailinhaonella thermotolerans TaxID=1070861 RepID=A0A3A4A1W2_9ACTN|nr:nitroreductase family protein [Bailinhaonella thermotolerans]RJL21228.1 nitroreductase family protein [Bailinhaonella thermotolerans]
MARRSEPPTPQTALHLDPTGVLRAILTRSAVRSYTAEPVPDAMVESMVRAMVSAPSASNQQAWAFVVVRDPVRLHSVRSFAPGVIGEPSLLLVACLDHSRYSDSDGAHVRRQGKLCVAMAVENFLLAAHALGLGACPVSSFLPGPIRLLLNMPDHLELILLVAAGHPATKPNPSTRRDLDEVVRYDGYR